ncbi:MAG TPA: hypothetical protein P5519_04710 [Spirochaetia bacterium]|nr:hypothetical protein [Spirochaetales bacterium]HRS65173.1 hypothetical protein [Spirochaetia bacterium]HPD80464.1 hypothetical protein [Spirochaetales bacterium]HQG39455.1 hypothetical protein [Spirochaetales bacterium]HQK34070.1 hypothetical protein [Spirochaetales bacterium]
METVKVSSHVPLAYAYTHTLSDRIALPVQPAQAIYAQFKHVSGFSADSVTVYGVDKLSILNTIIEHLQSMKKPVNADIRPETLDDKRINALIEQFSKQLHQAIVQSSTAYPQPLGITPGTVISIAA